MQVDDWETDGEVGSPIEMLEQCFALRGWPAERAGEGEVVATATGAWTQHELRGIWRAEDRVLQFIALPDIRVPADKRGACYEAIGLLNEQLWLGHFELWAATGLVVYRHAALVEPGDHGEGALSLESVEAIVDAAVDECERFYPVFQFILWADKSPAEAIAAALIDTQGEA